MTNAVTSANAPSLPGIESTAEARSILDCFQIEMENLHPVVNRFPSKAERAVMQQRNSDLTRLLRATHLSMADMDMARRMIAKMLNGYPSIRNKAFRDDRERAQWLDEQIASYLLDMQSLPLFAINLACDDAAKALIPDVDLDWPPTTPRLIKHARRKVEELSTERWKLDAVLRATKTMRAEVSDDEAERVRQGFAEVKMSMPTMDGVFTADEREKVARQDRERNYRAIEQSYRALGMEPPATTPQWTASPELRRKMGDPVVAKALKRATGAKR